MSQSRFLAVHISEIPEAPDHDARPRHEWDPKQLSRLNLDRRSCYPRAGGGINGKLGIKFKGLGPWVLFPEPWKVKSDLLYGFLPYVSRKVEHTLLEDVSNAMDTTHAKYGTPVQLRDFLHRAAGPALDLAPGPPDTPLTHVKVEHDASTMRLSATADVKTRILKEGGQEVVEILDSDTDSDSEIGGGYVFGYRGCHRSHANILDTRESSSLTPSDILSETSHTVAVRDGGDLQKSDTLWLDVEGDAGAATDISPQFDLSTALESNSTATLSASLSLPWLLPIPTSSPAPRLLSPAPFPSDLKLTTTSKRRKTREVDQANAIYTTRARKVPRRADEI
ncbi:hypothetical protein B0H17DRAFT_1136521 [Mycena rosella]|uniref:Uncharacterized protein n=1 Tax=Mycena rosella TaxID=1033263 RepID=A0AAD7DAU4_MYCRO|nr:hypothetical protein B0H17DRAFT_1136521 [Mycena rosella]